MNVFKIIFQEYQTAWIQIRPDVLSGLICVQTVHKDQQWDTGRQSVKETIAISAWLSFFAQRFKTYVRFASIVSYHTKCEAKCSLIPQFRQKDSGQTMRMVRLIRVFPIHTAFVTH